MISNILNMLNVLTNGLEYSEAFVYIHINIDRNKNNYM